MCTYAESECMCLGVCPRLSHTSSKADPLVCDLCLRPVSCTDSDTNLSAEGFKIYFGSCPDRWVTFEALNAVV